jgi:hypothetical protein
MLTTAIDQFRQHVQVNYDFTLPRIRPFLKQANRDYLKPVLGSDLLLELQELANSEDSASGEQGGMERILQAAREAEAVMAFYLAIPSLQLQMSQAGLHAVSNEQYKSAYQWQVGDFRESWMLAGYAAIEALYDLLAELRPAAWLQTNGYAGYHSSLLRNTQEFNAVYSIGESHITYVDLKPGLQRAQELVLRPTLGEAFYNSLIAHLAQEEDSSSGSAEADGTWNDRAIAKLRPALAQLAVAHATEVLFKTNNGALVSTRYEGNSSSESKGRVDDSTQNGYAALVRSTAHKAGMGLLAVAQRWLDDNHTHFPIYTSGPGYRPLGQDQRPIQERVHNSGSMMMV